MQGTQVQFLIRELRPHTLPATKPAPQLDSLHTTIKTQHRNKYIHKYYILNIYIYIYKISVDQVFYPLSYRYLNLNSNISHVNWVQDLSSDKCQWTGQSCWKPNTVFVRVRKSPTPPHWMKHSPILAFMFWHMGCRFHVSPFLCLQLGTFGQCSTHKTVHGDPGGRNTHSPRCRTISRNVQLENGCCSAGQERNREAYVQADPIVTTEVQQHRRQPLNSMASCSNHTEGLADNCPRLDAFPGGWGWGGG